MIFQQWEAVLNGTKTQTRRIVKSGQTVGHYADGVFVGMYGCVYSGKHMQLTYSVGHTYSVQPGRGKSSLYWKFNSNGEVVTQEGVQHRPSQGPDGTDYDLMDRIDSRSYLLDAGYREARIRITGIRREDVRNISAADLQAEGFDGFDTFMDTWISMHDMHKAAYSSMDMWCVDSLLRDYVAYRPAERYDAWKITFELVKE